MTRRLTQEGRKRAAREGLGCPRTFLIVVTGSLAVVIVYGPPISAYWHILLVVLAVATLLINVARCQKSKERMRVAVSEEVRADIGAELCTHVRINTADADGADVALRCGAAAALEQIDALL